jgi:hypothetical protein
VRALRDVMLSAAIAASLCGSAFSQGEERGKRVTSIDVGNEPLIITHDFDRPTVISEAKRFFRPKKGFLTLEYLFQVGNRTVVVLSTNLGGSGTLNDYTLLAVSRSAIAPNSRTGSRPRHVLMSGKVAYSSIRREKRDGAGNERGATEGRDLAPDSLS